MSYFLLLATVMLITGTMNTILMKQQVLTISKDSFHSKPIGFEHPFLQTMFMMLGEFACLGVFFLGKDSWKRLPGLRACSLFALPVICDLTSTTMINFA